MKDMSLREDDYGVELCSKAGGQKRRIKVFIKR